MLARRAWFRRLGGAPVVRRPPWTASDFTERCTRCNACLDACPEQVLIGGDGGFPQLELSHSGCSLCGDCASVCEAGVFDLSRVAFAWHAQIDAHCLALAGIHCRSCEDACAARAIRFQLQLGGPAQPQLDPLACTGCGACLAPCPNQAIRLIAEEPAHA
ncbi:ferredoxin-type protein NapF [Pseudomonas sp. UL073]|uniref:Ferredoxin-type protein NapF n=1 Tax=Zestomonas insulae TaxID=2809017 RepID=A0ABS2IFT6_9GAMM|nr:ferredoxin-type protein NapF [Pseudomonas insulae]MBM7060693.1 ferredoxin-type protein NapF [Pseudomonas insulae]